MVRGCLEWQRDGLLEPERVAMATGEYAVEQDEVGEFIRSCCVVGKEYTAHASTLYQAFKGGNPGSEMTQTAFGRELAERGYEKSRLTSGPHKAQHCWKGLKLADTTQNSPARGTR
jgi:putative DNA primase/helicase